MCMILLPAAPCYNLAKEKPEGKMLLQIRLEQSSRDGLTKIMQNN